MEDDNYIDDITIVDKLYITGFLLLVLAFCVCYAIQFIFKKVWRRRV